jgi:hypothetical protein
MMSIFGQLYLTAVSVCGLAFAAGLALAAVDRWIVRRGWAK